MVLNLKKPQHRQHQIPRIPGHTHRHKDKDTHRHKDKDTYTYTHIVIYITDLAHPRLKRPCTKVLWRFLFSCGGGIKSRRDIPAARDNVWPRTMFSSIVAIAYIVHILHIYCSSIVAKCSTWEEALVRKSDLMKYNCIDFPISCIWAFIITEVFFFVQVTYTCS